MTNNPVNSYSYFAAPVYEVDAPEYLSVARKVSSEYLKQRKDIQDLNPHYPVYMTENMHNHPELTELANFIGQTAWSILDSQGYAMDNLMTYFTEMWCQEHHMGSAMDRHIHTNGAVLSGFYFLDSPEDARVVFHDPRDSKVITSLPEKDFSAATHASNMINFKPVNGRLILSNSWLPHSFNKNTENIPLTFIHINIAVAPVIQQQNQVEII
jgi:uncharacterized protein (TIGR02466 family)